MNKAKRKGTAAETALVNYLNSVGIKCERRALAGQADRGDVAGIDNTVIEVKAAATLSIPAWLRELDVEKINANAAVGYLIIKPKGVGVDNVGKWWVIQRVEDVFNG